MRADIMEVMAEDMARGGGSRIRAFEIRNWRRIEDRASATPPAAPAYRRPTCRGEKHGAAKLWESAIIDIRKRRAMKVPAAVLAREYKVSAEVIRQITNGKKWAHVQ